MGSQSFLSNPIHGWIQSMSDSGPGFLLTSAL